MQVKIGSAPDSWGVWFPEDPKQIPWKRFLDEVADAGYEWTELGPLGYLPTDVEVLKKELSSRKLKVSGSFVMANLESKSGWGEVEQQLFGVGPILSAMGAKFLVLIDDTYSDLFTGELREPRQLDDDAWRWLIDTTHRVADIAQDRFGLKLVYHPHADTHVEYEDQIERFLDDTDPARIGVCLDTGHHAYRGGDPVRFFERHHPRIWYLHLKSVDRAMQKRVEAEKIPFARAVGMDLFCEPSSGAVDFPAFRDVLRQADYNGWATVEQDMYPAPFDKPLPIARRTRTYLREIGIG
ncbi:MAG: TIM barrel protein [Acidobacteria bacterium]|nr:TIM barrel protein [Acidobacteriota bacterium]